MKRMAFATMAWLTASYLLAIPFHPQVLPGSPFTGGSGGSGSISWPLLAPNGSTTAPSYSFTNATGAGLSYNTGAGYLQVSGQNASGTDQPGGNATVNVGRGTGTGAGGLFAVAIAPPAAVSGASLNALQNVILVDDTNSRIGGIQVHSAGTNVYAAYDRATGDTNGAAASVIFRAGQGTGTGNGGNLVLQVSPPAAGSGSTQNAAQTVFEALGSTGDVTITPGLPGSGIRGAISLSGGGTGGGLKLDRTVTVGGTTGAQTINKMAGTVNFAIAATAIVVTNSLVSTTSIVFTTMRTADATCTFVKSAVPASGSFTITVNAACAAETSVGFLVTN